MTFDPKGLSNDIYKVQFASLPATLYTIREDDTQNKIANALSAATGFSVELITKEGILESEASVFRRNLGINF